MDENIEFVDVSNLKIEEEEEESETDSSSDDELLDDYLTLKAKMKFSSLISRNDTLTNALMKCKKELNHLEKEVGEMKKHEKCMLRERELLNKVISQKENLTKKKELESKKCHEDLAKSNHTVQDLDKQLQNHVKELKEKEEKTKIVEGEITKLKLLLKETNKKLDDARIQYKKQNEKLKQENSESETLNKNLELRVNYLSRLTEEQEKLIDILEQEKLAIMISRLTSFLEEDFKSIINSIQPDLME